MSHSHFLFQCDRACGTGNQTRTVECSSGGASGGETHDASVCDADKRPDEVQTCNLGPCEGVEWIVSEWSGVKMIVVIPFSVV